MILMVAKYLDRRPAFRVSLFERQGRTTTRRQDARVQPYTQQQQQPPWARFAV